MVLRMDAKRKELIKKSSNEREVRWEDIRSALTVPSQCPHGETQSKTEEHIPIFEAEGSTPPTNPPHPLRFDDGTANKIKY